MTIVTNKTSVVSATQKPKTTTYTKKIILPKKEEITYESKNIPNEQPTAEAQIPLKSVFTSTVPQRRKFVSDTNDYNSRVTEYNQKIKEAKAQVDQYNAQVREYNKNRVVYKTYTTTSVPKTTTTTTSVNSDTGKTSKMTPLGLSFLNSFNKSTSQASTSQITSTGQAWLNTTSKVFEQKPMNFGQEVVSQFKQRPYTVIFTDIGKGFSTISKNPKEAGSILKEEGLPRLQSGATRVLNAFRLKGVKENPLTQEKAKQITNSYIIPGAKKTYDTLSVKSFPKTESEAKTKLETAKSRLSNPQYQANAFIIGGELLVGYGASKVPGAITSIKYKSAGTYVEPGTLYSKTAMKDPRGLDLTFNPTKTTKAFDRTFNSVPELPNQYVSVTQSRSSSLGKSVMTREQLVAKGLKQGSEPGLFISPRGTGQTGFLGIGETTSSEITFNPLKIFNQGTPTTYQIGFSSKVGTYPKSILNKPLNQTALEQYQISQSGKSKPIITRMSSLGTKREPEAIFGATTPLQEVKTPLYYTKVKGTIVPVKTLTVPKTNPINTNLLSSSKISAINRNVSSYESLLKGSSKTFVNPSILFPSSSYRSSSSTRSSVGNYFISYKPVVSSSKSPVIPIIKPYNPVIPSKDSVITTSKTSYINTTKSSVVYPTSPSYNPTILSPLPGYPKLQSSVFPQTRNPLLVPRVNDSKRKQEVQSYDTFVLDKKQWVKANKGNERNNYFGALKLGSEVTDNSSARSFKLKKAPGTANKIYPYQPNLFKFYQPSKQGNPKLTTAYIEKSKFLIDSSGERRDITAKAYIKNKLRGF